MFVEVIGGVDERPDARVVDVDDLSRLHLALGEVTDEAVEGRDAFLQKRDPDWSPYPWQY